jgi:hypothetical protein
MIKAKFRANIVRVILLLFLVLCAVFIFRYTSSAEKWAFFSDQQSRIYGWKTHSTG